MLGISSFGLFLRIKQSRLSICGVKGGNVMPGAIKRNQLKTHFAKIAQQYNAFRTFDREPIDVLATVVVEPGHTVCDIGCGTGRYLIPLVRVLESSGVRVEAAYGVDPCAKMLSVAAAVRNGTNQPIQWLRGTSDATRLPDNSLSLVTTFNAFHHFPVWDTLAEAQRILRRNGYFAVYNRVYEQEYEHVWGRWFPGYVEKSTVPKCERMLNLNDYNSSFELVYTRDFTFTREVDLQRIVEQTENKHYSTLEMYSPDEFEHAKALFVKRLERHFPDPKRITYPSSCSLFVYRMNSADD
jgi:ubiquinone/menaquinone biosynthesis C-methylase UbiE